MPINAGYEYFAAEKKFANAKTSEEKIAALEEMISAAPSHKGGENLRAQLRLRLKNFLEKEEKRKKTGKSSKKGIKKEGYQVVLVGLTNSGKSLLLSKITNAQPRVDAYAFTTKEPEIGAMSYQGFRIQVVDLPSIGSENFDSGIVNTADCLLIVIEKLDDLQQINPHISRSPAKRIIAFNKSDLLDSNQIRKLEETIKSKKLNGIIISADSSYNLENLKKEMIRDTGYIRVYTKEPGKAPAVIPVCLENGASIKEVADSIYKGFSEKVKESRITGPSSKFANQKVGLSHKVKDLDIVEFHTK